MAGRALRMGELTLCITPSGDGVIPHLARSGAQTPQLAKKVLTMRGRGLGEERGREALRATQACVVSRGFLVKFELNCSRLQIWERRSSLPSRCRGERLRSAGCQAGLLSLPSQALLPQPGMLPLGCQLTTRNTCHFCNVFKGNFFLSLSFSSKRFSLLRGASFLAPACVRCPCGAMPAPAAVSQPIPPFPARFPLGPQGPYSRNQAAGETVYISHYSYWQ